VVYSIASRHLRRDLSVLGSPIRHAAIGEMHVGESSAVQLEPAIMALLNGRNR